MAAISSGIVGTPDGDSFEAAPFHLFDGHTKRLGSLYHGGLRHRRACDPRANGVDVDVIAPQLVRRDHGHGNDGPFAGRVGGVGGAGIALPGDGGDVNNASPLALRNHLLRRPLHAEEHAFGVDTMDAVPVRLRDLHDVQIARHPGVVDDDVQPSERLHGLLHHAINARQLSNISLDGQAAATGGFDSGACLLGRLPINIDCCNGGSGLGVLQGDGTSHTPPGSRHQRDFFCQDHAKPPRCAMPAAVDCASDNP